MNAIKPASACSQLTELAFGCMSGACNPSGIIRSLAKAIDELDVSQISSHPAIKVILGQLSYLSNESLGPTPEAIEEYDQWRVWSEAPNNLTFEQYRAVGVQKKRWTKVSEPVPYIGGGCVMVHVEGESGGSMWLGIEPDGFVHS